MNANLENIKDKKILVVGLGKSGIAACQAMVRLGAEVSVQDSKREDDVDPQLVTFLKGKGVSCYFDRVPHDMGVYDMMILSPGVSPELPFIREAKDKGVEIIGELEIAYRIGQGRYAAITGTNGKTTTTTLVGEIFKAAGRKTYVVGNIGVAVISASLDAEEDAWMVTETSSFQLETTRYFKPRVSAVLNLTPDHLNRHHTMKEYGEAKAKIFANQTEGDYLVINYDDRECMKLAKGCRPKVVPFSRKQELSFGAFVKGDSIVIKTENNDIIEICKVQDLKIIGDHNLENALAAAAVSFFSGVGPDVIGRVLSAFRGVEHRLEYCGTVDGVKYYNDSKGTNIDAAVTAVRAVKEPIVLIAGGDAKGQVFDELIQSFEGHVKKMILLGRDAPMIEEAAKRAGFTDYVYCRDMDDCVRTAAEIAEKGDAVLLSPACASWDMYASFEQRGEHFKNCVNRLER